MNKQARQRVLLEIVRRGAVRSQEALLAELRRKGVEASQVTVSRDLRELGVAKLAGGTGRAYSLPGAASAPISGDRLRRLVRDAVVSMEAAGQFVVLKTPPSGAQPLGLALDQAAVPGIAGTIAGDDTVFVLARSVADAKKVLATLQAFQS